MKRDQVPAGVMFVVIRGSIKKNVCEFSYEIFILPIPASFQINYSVCVCVFFQG